MGSAVARATTTLPAANRMPHWRGPSTPCPGFRAGSSPYLLPSPIRPRHVPMRPLGHGLRHGIEATGAAGAAAGDAGEAHPAAGPEAVSPDGVARELRAGRGVPAVAAHEHAQRVAIGLDQPIRADPQRKVDNAPEAAGGF